MENKLTLIIFVILTLSGCNILEGGGEESTTDATQSSANPSSQGKFRIAKIGEVATYDCKIDYNSGSMDGVSGTSTMFMSVKEFGSNLSGMKCFEIYTIGELNIPEIGFSNTLESSNYFYQSSDGSIYKCGKHDPITNGLIPLDSGENGIQIDTYSPLQVGKTFSELYEYKNGEWEDCTTTIISKKIARVGLENKDAFVIQVDCKNHDGRTESSISYYVPSTYGAFPIYTMETSVELPSITMGTMETKDSLTVECNATNFNLK